MIDMLLYLYYGSILVFVIQDSFLRNIVEGAFYETFGSMCYKLKYFSVLGVSFSIKKLNSYIRSIKCKRITYFIVDEAFDDWVII